MSAGAENYGWSTTEGPESCHYITPEIIRILTKLGARRVCDVGSGNGALVAALAARNFYAIGVEYDKAGVAVSKAQYPNINFYNLGVQDDPATLLSAEGAQFDAVVSTEVIEHLYSPHLLPAFARKLLKPSGHLVISTPYHGYLKNLAISVFNKWDDHHTALWHGGHIKFWSPKTLKVLLEDNGFMVRLFSGVGRLPFLWKSMVAVAGVE